MKALKLSFGLDKPFLSCYNLKLTGGVVMAKNNNDYAIVPSVKNDTATAVSGMIFDKIDVDKCVSESYTDIVKCDSVSDEIKEKALEMKQAYDIETSRQTTLIIAAGLICFGAVCILTGDKHYGYLKPCFRGRGIVKCSVIS